MGGIWHMYEAPPLHRQRDADIGLGFPPNSTNRDRNTWFIARRTCQLASEPVTHLLQWQADRIVIFHFLLSFWSKRRLNNRTANKLFSIVCISRVSNGSSCPRHNCRVHFLLVSAPDEQLLQCLGATETEHHHCRIGTNDRRVGCGSNHSRRDAHCCRRHQQWSIHFTKSSTTVRVW